MGERANGLRGVSRQNASGLLMTKRADSLASASRVRYTSRRASLSRRNGDVFARLDKIATPSKVLSQLAWRAASPPVGACPHGANGRLAPSAQDNLSFVRIASPGSVPMGGCTSSRASLRPVVCVAVPVGFRQHQVFRRHLLHFVIEAKEVWSLNRKHGIVKYGELE